VRLGYSQSNGTDVLRRRIAALYPGASPDQVLVTNGSSEANFASCWRLLEPADKVAIMLPNYLQTWGLARNFGAEVHPFYLHEKQAWEPVAEEIRSAIASGTKLVVVINPHYPTGHVLDEARASSSSAAPGHALAAGRRVYQGAELDGRTTPSFWGSTSG
jgi:aspartate/methionine/tyrosine aminotransferase